MSAQGPTRRAAVTRDDWSTPWPLFAALDREFQFTLDAAADQHNRKCERWLEGPHNEPRQCFYCADRPDLTLCCVCHGTKVLADCTCGLCADWLEHTVFLNPPYGRGLENWIRKAREASLAGATVAVLLPANTDTAWFAMVFTGAAEIRFLSGRVNFEGSTSTNTGGSMVAIYRPPIPGTFGPRPLVSLWAWREQQSPGEGR